MAPPADWTNVAALVGQYGALSPQRTLEIMRQVTIALGYSKERGIVHSPIRPENLLVRRDGTVKLADIDPARSREDDAGSSPTMVDYLAPEQSGDSHVADVRSEIYSLGCTWYFMLTGQPPFPVASLTNKLRAHAQTPLPDPRSLNPEVPEALCGILRQMTKKQPSKRHQTLKQLLADLQTAGLVSNAIVPEPLADAAPARVFTENLALAEDKVSESSKGTAKSSRAVNDATKQRPAPADAAPEATPRVLRRNRRQLLETERRKRDNTLLFYVFVGSLLFCIVVAVIWLVQDSGTGFGPAENERMSNPFVRDPFAKNSGKWAAKKGENSNSSIGEGPSSSDQGSSATSITDLGSVSHSVISGQDAGRASSPDIEARLEQEAAFLPGWVMPPRRAEALITLTVKSGGSGNRQFATLQRALEHVPADGALIKLAGSGPFPLYPVKVTDKTRIVIEPENPTAPAPVIVLLVPEDSAESNFLEVSSTTLELRGVHLVLDGEGLSAAPDDALLSAVSSDVVLRNCSLSVKGTPDSPMSAVKIAGTVSRSNAKSGRAPRVLIENTVIRGNNLTSLTINTDQVNLALSNTVAWSGAATAICFGPTAPGDADFARNLWMASTTLCSQTCAVQIAGDAGQPIRTSIELLNSLVASPQGGKASSLLNMEGWNASQQQTACGTLINWKSTASLYTGWKTLIRLNPGALSAASDAAQWLAAWHDRSADAAAAIRADRWPDLPIADIYWAGLETLAPQTVGKQYVATGEGGWPGCQTERLPALVRLGSLDVAQGAATHAQLPRGLFQSAAREVIRVDLTREDLGKFLERRPLQNGTLIVASGSGVRQSSPIVVENAWVRLQFEQTGTAPLVLVPRPGKSKYDGFINVVNGGLEIVGGAFIPEIAEQKNSPNWFMQVIDSDLAMWRCCVRAPLTGAASNQGLIQWLAVSGRPPLRQFEGSYVGYAWFDSCYLAGSGTILEADLHARVVAFKNCVLVSRDDLFSLDLGQAVSQTRGIVDLSYSTFSAADRLFQIRGDDLGAPQDRRLRYLPIAVCSPRRFAPTRRRRRRPYWLTQGRCSIRSGLPGLKTAVAMPLKSLVSCEPIPRRSKPNHRTSSASGCSSGAPSRLANPCWEPRASSCRRPCLLTPTTRRSSIRSPFNFSPVAGLRPGTRIAPSGPISAPWIFPRCVRPQSRARKKDLPRPNHPATGLLRLESTKPTVLSVLFRNEWFHFLHAIAGLAEAVANRLVDRTGDEDHVVVDQYVQAFVVD